MPRMTDDMTTTGQDDAARQRAERLVEHARAEAVTWIRTGLYTRGEVAQRVRDLVHDDAVLDRAAAEAVVAPLWEEWLAEQRTWPETTDNDRLGRAFGRLERSGVVAVGNFSCCSRCGFSEIGGLRRPDSRGFVFFHQQDTERAAAGHGLYLRYGAFTREDAERRETAAIGREVVAALQAEGLSPEWDGSPSTVITVPMRWQLRLR